MTFSMLFGKIMILFSKFQYLTKTGYVPLKTWVSDPWPSLPSCSWTQWGRRQSKIGVFWYKKILLESVIPHQAEVSIVDIEKPGGDSAFFFNFL